MYVYFNGLSSLAMCVSSTSVVVFRNQPHALPRHKRTDLKGNAFGNKGVKL